MNDLSLSEWTGRRNQGIAAISLVLALTGCSAIEREEVRETENLLAAAGFKIKVARTPKRLAQLNAMTQHRMLRRLHNGRLMYVYPDAAGCGCFYFGTHVEYDRYKKLARERQIAEAKLRVSGVNDDTAMEWGSWGPRGP